MSPAPARRQPSAAMIAAPTNPREPAMIPTRPHCPLCVSKFRRGRVGRRFSGVATTALSPQLRCHVWQGNELAESEARVISRGYAALNRLLPGQGWSAGGLTELLIEHCMVGEMRLPAHALCHLTTHAERHVMLVWRLHISHMPQH